MPRNSRICVIFDEEHGADGLHQTDEDQRGRHQDDVVAVDAGRPLWDELAILLTEVPRREQQTFMPVGSGKQNM